MELVEAETLELGCVEMVRSIQNKIALEIAIQITAHLRRHSQALIHRDLKPGQCHVTWGSLWNGELDVKVIDFGWPRRSRMREEKWT